MLLVPLNHRIAPEERHDLFSAPIRIGKNVWIGRITTELHSVTIVDKAVIAAGAVVTNDISTNTVVAGVPAKNIRKME